MVLQVVVKETLFAPTDEGSATDAVSGNTGDYCLIEVQGTVRTTAGVEGPLGQLTLSATV